VNTVPTHFSDMKICRVVPKPMCKISRRMRASGQRRHEEYKTFRQRMLCMILFGTKRRTRIRIEIKLDTMRASDLVPTTTMWYVSKPMMTVSQHKDKRRRHTEIEKLSFNLTIWHKMTRPNLTILSDGRRNNSDTHSPLGVKRPGREADHLPTYSAENK
jgi:hypothetical protein